MFNHIWKYFRGGQTGNEANRLEREALSDPFLYEALEGLSGVEGAHEQIINDLQWQIQCCSHQKKGRFVYHWLAAVSFVLIGGVAILIMGRQVQQSQQQLAVNKFVMPDSIERVCEDSVMEIRSFAAESEFRQESRGKQEGDGMILEEADAERPVITANMNNKGDRGAHSVRHHKVASAPQPLLVTSKETRETQKYDPDTIKISGELQENEVVDEGNVIHGKTSNTVSVAKMSIQELTDAGRLRKFGLYVADSLRFPKEAKFQGIEGEVHLSVRLNKRGRPSRIKVVKSLSPACDKEAVRIVESYKGDLGTSERIVLIIPFK